METDMLINYLLLSAMLVVGYVIGTAVRCWRDADDIAEYQAEIEDRDDLIEELESRLARSCHRNAKGQIVNGGAQ
jgi:hypothetical protein